MGKHSAHRFQGYPIVNGHLIGEEVTKLVSSPPDMGEAFLIELF